MSRIELVGWALVHSLWQGIALAGVLYLVLRLVDQRRANVRYLVSVLALVLWSRCPLRRGFGALVGITRAMKRRRRVSLSRPRLRFH